MCKQSCVLSPEPPMELFQKLKISLFLIEDISELECWTLIRHLVIYESLSVPKKIWNGKLSVPKKNWNGKWFIEYIGQYLIPTDDSHGVYPVPERQWRSSKMREKYVPEKNYFAWTIYLGKSPEGRLNFYGKTGMHINIQPDRPNWLCELASGSKGQYLFLPCIYLCNSS